jgi:hypothetical protein
LDNTPTTEELSLLADVYRDFNARRIDAVLARMTEDVDWPNGMEGGRLHGHAEVRAYWTRQWAMISPHVEPLEFAKEEAERIAIKVHQVVHDLSGALLIDTMVRHIYTIRGGLIQKMDIQKMNIA